MIEAQLVEQSLPKPEIRGSNPVIGKFYLLSTVLKTSTEKTKIKRKRPGMAHSKKHSSYDWADISRLCFYIQK